MRTGGGGTRPADAGQATASCSGGHPPAAAGSAADTNRPDTNRPATDLVDTDRVPGAAADSQGVRGVRFGSHPDTGRGGRLGRTAADPQPPLRRDTRTAQVGVARLLCSSALVKWPGRRSQRRTAVRMPGHRRRPAEHREPARPGTADTRDRRRRGDTAAAATLDSRQQNRPPPGNGVRPERDLTGRHRPARPADRQIRRLVVYVHPVSLSAVYAAQVRGRIQPGRLSPVWYWLVD
jgi:hypothetical protein